MALCTPRMNMLPSPYTSPTPSPKMNHQAVDETLAPHRCIGGVSRSHLSPKAQEALHCGESTESLDIVDGGSASNSQAGSKHVLASSSSMGSGKLRSSIAYLTMGSNIDDRNLADELRSMVIVKDRKWRLKTYRNCFVGSEAVDMLTSAGHAKTREEAVLLGRRLEQVEGLFEHVCEDHPFDDGYFFYTFKKKNREQRSFATLLSSASEGSSNDSVSEEISVECQKVATAAANAIIKTLWTVPVQDRRYRLKSYPQCFVGSDAVSLLVSSGHAASREEAVLIGRVLCHRYNLFHHVEQEHLLEDKYLFFRFSSKSEKRLKYSISPDTVAENYRFSRRDKDAVDGLWKSLFRMVECKDRMYQLRTYKNCFVGSEAVDYLVSKALAKSRSDAVRIARLVNSQLDLFEHVSNEHDFDDGYYFYRFKQHTTFVDESGGKGGF